MVLVLHYHFTNCTNFTEGDFLIRSAQQHSGKNENLGKSEEEQKKDMALFLKKHPEFSPGQFVMVMSNVRFALIIVMVSYIVL